MTLALLLAPLRIIAATPTVDLEKLEAVAEAGDAVAQEQLGYAYSWGIGVAADPARARHWLELAVKADRRLANTTLAQLLVDGVGGPKDMERARQLFGRAAMQGDAQAQSALAYYAWDEKPDPKRIIPLLEAAARQGNDYAMRYLADIYAGGTVVPVDRERAFKYELRAAQLGNREAQINAAFWQFLEPGNQQKIDYGFALLEHAAAKGNPRAMFVLGMHYWTGFVRARDGAQATRWLAAAVNAGHAHAGLFLAQCYATGFGVERDPLRAEWLFVATERTAGISEQNHFAWDLAVSPKAELRDGARAVSVMKNLLQVAEQRPAYLDTLAAAYAEAGQFEEAVRTQLEANARLGAGVPAATRAGFDQRLALYRARKPYREQP